MATESSPLISNELFQQVEEVARAQQRQPAEVVEEAVGRYVASQRLARLSERMETKARAMGIGEEDVPRLIQELRRV